MHLLKGNYGHKIKNEHPAVDVFTNNCFQIMYRLRFTRQMEISHKLNIHSKDENNFKEYLEAYLFTSVNYTITKGGPPHVKIGRNNTTDNVKRDPDRIETSLLFYN